MLEIPVTTIPVAVPREVFATIDIFNLLGQKVRNLHNGLLTTGRHYLTWDGTGRNGRIMPSGLYLYRLRLADGRSWLGKMVFIK